MAQRKAKHYSCFKCWKNGKTNYVTSYKIFEDDEEGCKIILLELFPCNTKEELQKRERSYIESNECVNKYRPTRTDKEYRDENKDKMQEYRINNKKYFQEYNKQYFKDNKDNINQLRRLRRNKNKEILNQNKVQHKCVCGSNYSTVNKSQHLKTIKHQKYMNSTKAEQAELHKLEEKFNSI